MKVARPDGRVDARGSTIRRLSSALGPLPSGPFTAPAWLATAFAEEGVKEIAGRPQNTPRILEYLATATQLAKIDDTISVKGPSGKTVRQKTGYKMGSIDETAWCACFVNWCLEQAGEARLRGASAQAYRAWEKASDQSGAIAVIKREPFNDSSSGFHVGFYVGGNRREGYVALLGGNQNNSVCRKWFVGIEPQNIWLRWPESSS